MRVLLLEDDAVLLEIMEEFLLDSGYDVTAVTNGNKAEELIADNPFDLLLLDINVPGKNGMALFRDIYRKIPTIFITSIQSAAEVKKAFSLGADDYLKKPFDLEELEARIEHIKRIHGLDPARDMKVGSEARFDLGSLKLEAGTRSFQLKRKEADILTFFVRNSGRVISSSELIDNVWAYDDVPTDATIRTYIKNLRQMLGKEAITTVKGVGYRFDPL